MLPNIDHPEAFGQHPNADIASQIIETRFVYLENMPYGTSCVTSIASAFVSVLPIIAYI